MSFKERPLTTNIYWEKVSKNRFVMIKLGMGEALYWKGCNVTVYEKDDKGNEKPRKLVGMSDGEGVAEGDVKLYVTDGKVTKEIVTEE